MNRRSWIAVAFAAAASLVSGPSAALAEDVKGPLEVTYYFLPG